MGADTKSIKIVTLQPGISLVPDNRTIPEDQNIVPDEYYGKRSKDTITHGIESQIKTIHHQDESRGDEWIAVEGKKKNSKADENTKSTALVG